MTSIRNIRGKSASKWFTVETEAGGSQDALPLPKKMSEILSETELCIVAKASIPSSPPDEE
jgi:hypothetical protein